MGGRKERKGRMEKRGVGGRKIEEGEVGKERSDRKKMRGVGDRNEADLRVRKEESKGERGREKRKANR